MVDPIPGLGGQLPCLFSRKVWQFVVRVIVVNVVVIRVIVLVVLVVVVQVLVWVRVVKVVVVWSVAAAEALAYGRPRARGAVLAEVSGGA